MSGGSERTNAALLVGLLLPAVDLVELLVDFLAITATVYLPIAENATSNVRVVVMGSRPPNSTGKCSTYDRERSATRVCRVVHDHRFA